jgi:hypothetical protein
MDGLAQVYLNNLYLPQVDMTKLSTSSVKRSIHEDYLKTHMRYNQLTKQMLSPQMISATFEKFGSGAAPAVPALQT